MRLKQIIKLEEKQRCGFGNGFQKCIVESGAYIIRQMSFNSIEDFTNNYRSDYETSYSTINSNNLADMDYENPIYLVLKLKVEKNGKYTEYDADAGVNYGYDELIIEKLEKDEFEIVSIYNKENMVEKYKEDTLFNKEEEDYLYDLFEENYQAIKDVKNSEEILEILKKEVI